MKLSYEALASVMNRMPFVRWDRFIARDGDGCVYGWIDRPDGRADFALIDFWQAADGLHTSVTTSSAKHSLEIARIFGSEDQHEPCKRVVEYFGDLVENVVAP